MFLVRKQHIDESLRVEYTTAGDDEVWIPPGKKWMKIKGVDFTKLFLPSKKLLAHRVW
jgi:hypothetical protein